MRENISVLIPIYNQNVNILVDGLINQLKETGVEYELILIDDGSDIEYKSKHQHFINKHNVIYEELPHNVGRSKIRNILISRAQFQNLLFLDCDSVIISSDFIYNYITSVGDVIYGGTVYSDQLPNFKVKLHWHYGKKYEACSIEKRLTSPFLTFKTNNFLINKSILLNYPFDEDITEYGYEDTVFAISLMNENIYINHISNPVQHGGLDINRDYLVKVEKSIKSLKVLEQRYPLKTKLTRLYSALNFLPVNYLMKRFQIPLRAIILKYPNATLLQLYKLALMF